MNPVVEIWLQCGEFAYKVSFWLLTLCYRYLSFDIEAKRKKKGFCKASEDPCILICTALSIFGKGITHRAVFALVEPGQSVDPIAAWTDDAGNVCEAPDMFIFTDEGTMLLAFAQFIRESDPDAFTGWNVTNFDIPYLVGRAEALGISEQFLLICKVEGKAARLRQQVFQSKAYGAKKSNELLCEGRFDYDGLVFMLRGQMTKYRSYKLNAISKEVIGDQKVDIDYTQIPRLHEGTSTDRSRLAWYCLKDALLPLQILDKLMAVINGSEQSRVTGVPIKWLLSRGQGIKTFSNILRYKDACEVVPSRTPKTNSVYTAGGYVRDPITGYYKYPLATLDFSSLYPSIMQAYNICYSTEESLAWARQNLTPDDYWIPEPTEVVNEDGSITLVPSEICFVKKHIREGVLPALLTDLLAQRAYVKNLMKSPEAKANKSYYNVLDGRQLAIKLVCNSVYGFVKGYVLTNPRLMTAVTGWGQWMIKRTAAIIEERFKDHSIVDRKACEAMGIDYEEPGPDGDLRPRCKYSARIIYGDTDSVIVDFGDIGLQDVATYGRMAAAMCTEQFEKPNSLAFESVKLRSIMIKKKRYASLEILAVLPGERIAAACKRAKVSYKGLESKRRDNAPIGSETQSYAVDTILQDGNVEGAFEYVKGVISDILMDRVDMSKFIISKGLSKTAEQYKAGGTRQQHTDLVERIAKRAKVTGETVPETGDRVPYVMVAGTAKTSGKGASKAFELAEDPQYAQEHNIPLNKQYYIEKQVMAATLRIFTTILESDKLHLIHSTMPQATLESLQAYQMLFMPHLPHMKKRKRVFSSSYGIGKHAEVLPQCMHPNCHVRLPPDATEPVCSQHWLEEVRLLLDDEHERKQAIEKETWDICRACAGGGFAEVTCSNTICDNYYKRARVSMDIEDIVARKVQLDTPLVPQPVKPMAPITSKTWKGAKRKVAKRERVEIDIASIVAATPIVPSAPKKQAKLMNFFNKST